MLNLRKPVEKRNYSITIKNKRNCMKSFSLYGVIDFDLLKEIVHKMLTDEKEAYLDLENRYSFDRSKRDSTHYVQIVKFTDRGRLSKSFTVQIEEYTSIELGNIIEHWLKEADEFPDGEVKRLIKDAKSNNRIRNYC